MSQLRRCSIALRCCTGNPAVLPLIPRNVLSRSYAKQSLAAGHAKQDELLNVWNKCWFARCHAYRFKLIDFTSPRLQHINTDRPQRNNRIPWQASQCWKTPIFRRPHHNVRRGDSDLFPCRWRTRVTRAIPTSACICARHCSRTIRATSAVGRRNPRQLINEANIIPTDYSNTQQCPKRPYRDVGCSVPPNETAFADSISPGVAS